MSLQNWKTLRISGVLTPIPPGTRAWSSGFHQSPCPGPYGPGVGDGEVGGYRTWLVGGRSWRSCLCCRRDWSLVLCLRRIDWLSKEALESLRRQVRKEGVAEIYMVHVVTGIMTVCLTPRARERDGRLNKLDVSRPVRVRDHLATRLTT